MYLGCTVRVAICGTEGSLVAYDESQDVAHVRVAHQIFEVPFTSLELLCESG